jgi:alpha-L-rhamnosidase
VYDSPHGRIESSWRVDAGRFQLLVTVPPGTTCEIVLPDGSRHERPPGVATSTCELAVGDYFTL